MHGREGGGEEGGRGAAGRGDGEKFVDHWKSWQVVQGGGKHDGCMMVNHIAAISLDSSESWALGCPRAQEQKKDRGPASDDYKAGTMTHDSREYVRS